MRVSPLVIEDTNPMFQSTLPVFLRAKAPGNHYFKLSVLVSTLLFLSAGFLVS
jgi:hypothetical protein